MILKKAVEPTHCKGAETQGFRLLGAITHWVSYVNLFFLVIFLSLAPLPLGVFALTAVFRFNHR